MGTLADLKEQLAMVRKHVDALDDQELELGLRCVAVRSVSEALGVPQGASFVTDHAN